MAGWMRWSRALDTNVRLPARQRREIMRRASLAAYLAAAGRRIKVPTEPKKSDSLTGPGATLQGGGHDEPPRARRLAFVAFGGGLLGGLLGALLCLLLRHCGC